MIKRNWQRQLVRSLLRSLIAVVLVISLIGCSGVTTPTPSDIKSGSEPARGKIAEVSPPAVIQQLRQELDNYQPQVTILSPAPDEVVEDNTVEVQFQVKDLPIFQNADLGLGPHLQVFLDNQPYQSVYNVTQPLVLEDLPAGTHTLRVFAAHPWNESFKNGGSYAQTTFHIFTKTEENIPDPTLPLLTYNHPQASYGAEPIMLDFYLSNAPQQLVDEENADAKIRVRCTINGESFIINQWEPIYLEGFKPGKNWVQLELLDFQGKEIKNVFNNTIRVISYNSDRKDTLAQLVRGELSADDARGIIDQSYVAKQPAPTPSPTETPTPVTPTPTPTEIPTAATPTPTPTEIQIPAATPTPTEIQIPAATPTPTEIQIPAATPTPTPIEIEIPAATPTPTPIEIEIPAATPTPTPIEIEIPAATATPTVIQIQIPAATPSPTAEETPAPQQPFVEPTKPTEIEPPKGGFYSRFPRPDGGEGMGGWFNRFRRSPIVNPTPSPTLPPTLPAPATPKAVSLPEPLPEVKSPEPTNTIEEQMSQTNPPVKTEEPTEAAPAEPSESQKSGKKTGILTET